MPRAVKVARVSDLQPGKGTVVTVDGKAIGLFNVKGKYYALDNVCLHRGGPVAEGELEGNIVTCPWHGWQYDVISGQNIRYKSAKLQTYRVSVNSNDIFLEV